MLTRLMARLLGPAARAGDQIADPEALIVYAPAAQEWLWRPPRILQPETLVPAATDAGLFAALVALAAIVVL